MRRGQSLKQQAYQAIREQILTGGIGPGEAIAEEPLARELGISRTPVREAILELRKEGILSTVPKKGSFVEKLSLDELVEIYDLREALEGLAARLLASKITDEQVAELAELAKALKLPSWTVAEDVQFHEKILQYSGNRKALDIVRTFRIQVIRYDEKARSAADEGRLVFAGWTEPSYSHQGIVRALASRDAALAEDLARRHVRSAKNAVLGLTPEVGLGESRSEGR